MLKPAQLYKEEIKTKLIEHWYDPRCQHYFAGNYREWQIPDNCDWRREFACVSSSGEVIGYFSYSYDEISRSMANFGLISFVESPIVLLDAVRHTKLMLESGMAQRVEIWAFADNPANEIYEHFMQKFGGWCCGKLDRTCFYNGKFHDSKVYQLLVENYVKSKKK